MIKVANDEHRAGLRVLAGFFTDALAERLRGTGIDGDVREGPLGSELRLSMRYTGVMALSGPHEGEDKAAYFQRSLYEAEILVDNMKAALAKAAAGKLDT